MLQDSTSKPGGWFEPFDNPALWSVSYECWFYLFFILIVSMASEPVHQRLWAAGIAIAGTFGYLLFPNQICTFAMYFAIWWAGVEIAREVSARQAVTWRQGPLVVAMVILAAAWSIPLLKARSLGHSVGFGDPPFLELRHILAAIAIVVVSVIWNQLNWAGFRYIFGWAAFLAPVSYAVYLVHSPVLLAIAHSNIGSPAVKLLATLAITALLAIPMELLLQPAINRWTNRFLSSTK
jgi:peptidoglycan/LPS O-acetylase OafA/YrhL